VRDLKKKVAQYVGKISMDIIIELDNKKIKIVSSVVDLMNSYKQTNAWDFEAGGILIGRENIETGNIIIEYATEPYCKDKRQRNFFYRKDKRHIEYFRKLHEENNGIYAYVGEWHTHPEDYPNYSCIDINNWSKISNINDDKEKIYYHIIIGKKEVRAWEYSFLSKEAKRIY
jgi:integrative and conjugative element protein (TIGR02256 family)